MVSFMPGRSHVKKRRTWGRPSALRVAPFDKGLYPL